MRRTFVTLLTILFLAQTSAFAQCDLNGGHADKPSGVIPDTGNSARIGDCGARPIIIVVNDKNELDDLIRRFGCPKDTDHPDEPEEPVNPGVGNFLRDLQEKDLTDEFNRLFGTGLEDEGTGVGEDAQVLADLLNDPNYDAETFTDALPRAASLYKALQDDPAKRAQFNLMFGLELPASGDLSPDDRKALFDITGDPLFNQETFLTVLDNAASLVTALQTDEERRENYNETFSTEIPASGSPTLEDSTQVFGLAGSPTFDLDAFLETLDDPTTGPGPIPGEPGDVDPPTGSALALLNGLQSTGQTDEFNRVFGTDLPVSGNPTQAADVQLLFDLTGDPAFDLSGFADVLPVADSLLTSLQSNPTRLQSFNTLFGTSLPASGAPAVNDRKPLFDTTGTPGYEEEEFLTVLDRTSGLLAALRANSVALASYNEQFGTTIGTGNLTVTDRTQLFGLAGDPNFNLTVFLDSL